MPQYNPRQQTVIPSTTNDLVSLLAFPTTPLPNQVVFLHDQTPASNDGVYRWDDVGGTWDQLANLDTGTTGWITDEFVDFAGATVTLSQTPADAVEKMLVYRNGVLEEKSGYTIVGTALTFVLPNTSGLEDIVVFYQT